MSTIQLPPFKPYHPSTEIQAETLSRLPGTTIIKPRNGLDKEAGIEKKTGLFPHDPGNLALPSTRLLDPDDHVATLLLQDGPEVETRVT